MCWYVQEWISRSNGMNTALPFHQDSARQPAISGRSIRCANGSPDGSDGNIRFQNIAPGTYSRSNGFDSSSSAASAYIVDVRQNGQSIFDSGLIVGRLLSPQLRSSSNNGATIQAPFRVPIPLQASCSKVAWPRTRRAEEIPNFTNGRSPMRGPFHVRGIAPETTKCSLSRMPRSAFAECGFHGTL
jgi:hypothetical protein